MRLSDLDPIKALIVVTKSGCFPSSNSTLYFEQAMAQINGLAKIGTLAIPIRLVGLTLLETAEAVDVTWSDYPGRYSRLASKRDNRRMRVIRRRKGKHGVTPIVFSEASDVASE